MRIRAARTARIRAYEVLGELSAAALSPVLGEGGHTAYRVVRRPGRTALLSDGLSDPFPDGAGPGLGLEFVIEADAVWPDAVLPSTWPFSALEQLCALALRHGEIGGALQTLGCLSVEVHGEAFPPTARSAAGRVGLLLGGPSSDLPPAFVSPEGPVWLVPLRVLTSTQLQTIVEGGDRARDRIAQQMSGLTSSVSC